METAEFSGSFFEAGQQQGRIYRKNGMTLDWLKISETLCRGQLEAYEKFYPEQLDEIRGIASSAGLDEKKALYFFTSSEILYYRRALGLDRGCTILGVKNRNGSFVGRNYDWLPRAEKFFSMYRVKSPVRNSFAAVTDMGVVEGSEKRMQFFNADDAVNTKGLYIGLTFAYSDKTSNGLGFSHAIKMVAETCSTVKEALKVLGKIPLCRPESYFIADASGEMAVVEHNSRKSKVLKPENGILAHTNHYLDRDLAEEDAVLKVNPSHTTFQRYREVLKKANEIGENFSQKDTLKALCTRNSCTLQNTRERKTI